MFNVRLHKYEISDSCETHSAGIQSGTEITLILQAFLSIQETHETFKNTEKNDRS